MPSAAAISWREGMEQYLARYSPLHHAPATVAKIKTVFRALAEFLLLRSIATLEELTRRVFMDYQLAIAGGRSPATTNQHVNHLGAWLSWLVSEDLLEKNPAEGVRRLKVSKRDRSLPLAEVRRLLEFLDRREEVLYGDLAKLTLNCGLRPGETLHVRGADVDLEARLLWVRSRAEYPIKTRRERIVPLNACARLVLGRRKERHGAESLFPRDERPRHLSNISKRFGQLAREAGVEATLYRLRHTFATVNASRMNEWQLAAIMGHTQAGVTGYYVHARSVSVPPPQEIR